MIVVIGTRKGGAGKSSISLNIAALRKLKGFDVCLVDCDDQKTTTRWGESRLENDVNPVIPLINAQGKGVSSIIREQSTRYNDLVIDVPGRDAVELRNSILVCDVLVMPVKVSLIDVWALEKDIEMVYELQEQRRSINLPMRCIMFFNEVPTLPNVRNKQLINLADHIYKLNKLIEDANIDVCPIQISDRDSFKKVLEKGKSIFEIDDSLKTGSDVSAQTEMEALYNYIYNKE